MSATLPNRRFQHTETVVHAGMEYAVTFGRESPVPPYGRVTECFCTGTEDCKVGSDAQSTINDACIAISLLMQRGGMTIAELADAFGENRGEGEASGPPSSPLGAITRAGAAIEREGAG